MSTTVAGAGEDTEMSAPTPRPEAVRRRSKTTARRLYVTGALVLLAIGFLIFKGVTSAFVYFKTANQAIADRAALGNSTFQIEGEVVPGTLVEPRIPGATIRFQISSGPVRVPVLETGVPPALFGTGVPVVLVGHFVGTTNVFASDQILVKHSSTYIAAHPNRVRAANGTVH